MIEPRILALRRELQKSKEVDSAALAGLFALLGSGFAQGAAVLKRAAEVVGEEGPAVEIAAQAIEEQAGKPRTDLGIALQKALRKTN